MRHKDALLRAADVTWLTIKLPIGIAATIAFWAWRFVAGPATGAWESFADECRQVVRDARSWRKAIIYTYTLKLTGRNRWKEDRERFMRLWLPPKRQETTP